MRVRVRACGVEGSYSRSSECQRLRSRLRACSNIPTVCSDGSGGLEWQGRGGQQTTNVLLMCLQWAWAWAWASIAAVRTKEAQVGVHEVTFNDDVAQGPTPFPSEEEAIMIWKNCTQGPCGVPEADELLYISHGCLLKDQHSCGCTWIRAAVSAAASFFASQARRLPQAFAYVLDRGLVQ